jgi:hypothetical protein
MKERGIKHTTSECTLRGFTCAQADVDPKVATPAEIARIRAIQTGHQVQGITGGLEVGTEIGHDLSWQVASGLSRKPRPRPLVPCGGTHLQTAQTFSKAVSLKRHAN